MRRIAALLALCLALTLFVPVSAAKERETPEYDFSDLGLDGVMAQIMEKYRLNEDNFALGWEDLETGDDWFYQEDRFMVGGSMYKMPLNMVLTDMIDSGELENTESIQQSRYNSIVYSDNEAAQWLRKKISENNLVYRSALARYSGFEPEDLPDSYFRENRFSPRFMINTLRYLYDNSETYAFVLDCMKLAHPGRFFCKYQGDYEVAHKYGYYENALCDSAIVYTQRPFLLVCMTQSVANGEELLGELCEMFAMYSDYLDSLPPAEENTPAPEIMEHPKAEIESPKAQLAVQPGDEAPAIAEESTAPAAKPDEPNGVESVRAGVMIALAGALVILAAALGAAAIRKRRQ